MWESERFDVAERVAASKARLSDRLSELSRRVDAVREAAHPAELVKRPLVLFAAAGVLGLWLGSRPRRRALPEPAATAGPSVTIRQPPGVLRSVLREVLVAAAGAWTRKYIARHW
jgi:hypothetical protein